MRWPIFGVIGIFPVAMLAATAVAAQSLSDACPGADLGKPEQAIEACTAAIDSGRFIGAAQVRALIARGILHHGVGKLAYGRHRDEAMAAFDRAIADFSTAIGLEPRSAAAHVARGTVHFDKLELDQAIADYGTAIRLDPASAKAHFMRGYAWFSKGDADRALSDYAEAIRLKPDYADVYEARGRIYLIRRDYAGTIANATAQIGLDPKDGDAYLARADAHRALGEHDRAIADYDAALSIYPDSTRAAAGRTASDAAKAAEKGK